MHWLIIVIVLISMFQMNSAVQQPDQSPLTRTFDSIVDIHFLTLHWKSTAKRQGINIWEHICRFGKGQTFVHESQAISPISPQTGNKGIALLLNFEGGLPQLEFIVSISNPVNTVLVSGDYPWWPSLVIWCLLCWCCVVPLMVTRRLPLPRLSLVTS